MKQIIAMGGGGFSMEPDNLVLDQYILDQSRKALPKILFLPTASGDAEGYIKRFYDSFNSLPCIPSHLSLFKLPGRDLERFILHHDIVYVGGGNTKSMLALWREWGVDRILRKGYEEGIILSGLSAGSICWFESGVTDSFGDELDIVKGLGFIQGSHSPHYDGEAERRPAFHSFIERGLIPDGYGADDGAALHFVDGALKGVLTSRPHASAYKVEGRDGIISETKLGITYLNEHNPSKGRPSMIIKEIPAKETYELRHEVLRPGQPLEACIYEGDEDERTFHIGVYLQDRLVCIGSFYPEQEKSLSQQNQYRLRGMATLESERGKGIGSKLIAFAESAMKDKGAEAWWCNARTTAVPYYEKLGLQKVGDEFHIPEIGPHYVMCKIL